MRRLFDGASIIALVALLILGGGTGVALAGHSFDDPMYTTGDGDLWVIGGLDVDGTCQLDGAVTFTDAMTGDDLTLSGTLAVGGATAITDSLYVSGSTLIGGNLTVTAEGGALGNAFVDSLYVLGNATVAGELEGARCLLGVGVAGSNMTADTYFNHPGGVTYNGARGALMARPGSIVGASAMFNVDSYTPVATVEIEVSVNGTPVYEVEATLAGTGFTEVYDTQARGEDTFSAGDFIIVRFDITGTLQFDSVCGLIELQFDE